VLFVDLNGLKQLNDSFGHMGGDAALVTVAEKLIEGTRATDCVARLGGDEFCVLLEHADEKSAIETAERLVEIIADEECLFEGSPMPLSVAIGVTLIEKGDTAATVLARADKACRVKPPLRPSWGRPSTAAAFRSEIRSRTDKSSPAQTIGCPVGISGNDVASAMFDRCFSRAGSGAVRETITCSPRRALARSRRHNRAAPRPIGP
jgi:hypothetical protein